MQYTFSEVSLISGKSLGIKILLWIVKSSYLVSVGFHFAINITIPISTCMEHCTACQNRIVSVTAGFHEGCVMSDQTVNK